MKVILDTNIVFNSFLLNTVDFKLFFTFSKRMDYDICIPKIVYDEILNKYKECLCRKENEYKKIFFDIKKISLGQMQFSDIDVNVLCKKYKKYFDNIIKEYNIKILNYPKIKHEKIIKHELLRIKPFNLNGTGYRDKLIFETIIEGFAPCDEKIIFISNNSKDFGIEPKLFENLFFEKNVKNVDNWSIKNSLHSFINEYINPLIGETSIDVAIIIMVNDYIVKQLKGIVYENDLMCACIGCSHVSIKKIDAIKAIDIININMEGNENTCNVKIKATIDYSISADSDELFESETLRDILGYSIDDCIADHNNKVISYVFSSDMSEDIELDMVLNFTKDYKIIDYELIQIDAFDCSIKYRT